mgnify:CR=1 FL=1
MADLTYEVPAAVAALDAPQPASGMSMARQTLNTVSLRNPAGGGKKNCVFLLILFSFIWFCFGVLPEVLPFPLRGGR